MGGAQRGRVDVPRNLFQIAEMPTIGFLGVLSENGGEKLGHGSGGMELLRAA